MLRSSNKMPAAIRAALVEALEIHGEMDEDLAKNYIMRMEREQRLIEECWS
jgi:sulfite reductase alpha subunit-like flavoprotein